MGLIKGHIRPVCHLMVAISSSGFSASLSFVVHFSSPHLHLKTIYIGARSRQGRGDSLNVAPQIPGRLTARHVASHVTKPCHVMAHLSLTFHNLPGYLHFSI
ncbi:hypothetical protein Scep_025774 [Stephania cephalantha]|uniref:Uncharacterized protein n=1 Tax=Stephania cephalantha TaxID=152367 RepID=A0AAP0HSR9_9MAGN